MVKAGHLESELLGGFLEFGRRFFVGKTRSDRSVKLPISYLGSKVVFFVGGEKSRCF